MAALPIQAAPINGSIDSLTFTAAAASDTYTNDGRTVLVVQNGDVASKTVTIPPTQDRGNLDTPTGTARTVAAGEFAFIGPLDPSIFGVTCTVTPSATTSVSYAVVRLPRAVGR